jgi:hypothetical protein
MIVYSLDDRDRLIAVGGAWDEFACANHGDHLTRDQVLGKPLFDYVAGPEIQHVYKALFARVRRAQRALTFLFRCDAPACCRRMRMKIEPLPENGLAIRTELLDEIPRGVVPVLDPSVPRTDEALHICCICANVKSQGDTWVPIEEESARLGLFETRVLPRLSHGYCPSCLDDQIRLIDAEN